MPTPTVKEVSARDDRRWTLKQRHTSAGRYLEAYGPWVYGEDPIEVVPAATQRAPVAYWRRRDGKLRPIYSTSLARSVQYRPQFAGWAI